jgi:hypothetical protein
MKFKAPQRTQHSIKIENKIIRFDPGRSESATRLFPESIWRTSHTNALLKASRSHPKIIIAK